MSEEYVSKEVFAEAARRYEVMLEAERLKFERHADKLSSVYQSRNDKLKNDVETLKQRLEDIQDSVNRGITILGVCITAIGMLFAGVQIYIALYL